MNLFSRKFSRNFRLKSPCIFIKRFRILPENKFYWNPQKKVASTHYVIFFKVEAGPTPSGVSHRAPKVGDTDQNPAFSAEFSAESNNFYSTLISLIKWRKLASTAIVKVVFCFVCNVLNSYQFSSDLELSHCGHTLLEGTSISPFTVRTRLL